MCHVQDEESRVKVKGVSVDDITPYSAPELASAQHGFEVDLYSLGEVDLYSLDKLTLRLFLTLYFGTQALPYIPP